MIRNLNFLKISLLSFGFMFLYFPIFTLVFYSFNDSERVMVWTSFSFRWYSELFHNEQILEAFYTSLKVAFLSASVATIIGVMVGYSLARIKYVPFRIFFYLHWNISISYARNNIRSFIFVIFYNNK